MIKTAYLRLFLLNLNDNLIKHNKSFRKKSVYSITEPTKPKPSFVSDQINDDSLQAETRTDPNIGHQYNRKGDKDQICISEIMNEGTFNLVFTLDPIDGVSFLFHTYPPSPPPPSVSVPALPISTVRAKWLTFPVEGNAKWTPACPSGYPTAVSCPAISASPAS